jgi:uncharacterized protein
MKPLFATLCCLAFTGIASANITIQGTGKVVYVPDVGYVHVGVVSEGKTAGEAWEKNGEKVRKIFEALKKLGFDTKDLKTMSMDVSPKYYTPRDAEGKPLDPVLVGYTASYRLTVTVRKLDYMGQACDAVVENGANRDMSISFGCSDLDKLIKEARQKAIADAREQAELYVNGAGASLGLLQSINQGYAAQAPMYRYEHALKATADKTPLPIAAGEQEVTVSVTATWNIAHVSK